MAATWITNPLTFVQFNFDFDNMGDLWHSFYSWFFSLGKAYLIGLPIVSIVSALIGYILVRLFWRIMVTLQYYRRRKSANKITADKRNK